MTTKVKAAIIGSGNIGTDLLYKALRSDIIEPVWVVGIDPESEGLKRAKELGLKTTADGVKGMEPHIVADKVQIAWDATSAYVHESNNELVKKYGVRMVDLTPAAIGPFCVPPVNLLEMVGQGEQNVNMVTCGGQATIPMVAAVSRVQARRVRGDHRDGLVEVCWSWDTQEHRRVYAHDRQGCRGGRRGGARKGDHHHQPRGTTADDARYDSLPDQGCSEAKRDHRVGRSDDR